MPHEYDIRDEIDALLQKIDATMAGDSDTGHNDEPAQPLQRERTENREDGQSRLSSLAGNYDEPTERAADENDQPMQQSAAQEGQAEPTIITVYVFDKVPPPFAAWADRENAETNDLPDQMAQMVESTLQPSLADNDQPFFEEDALEEDDGSPTWENVPTTTPTPRHRRRPRTVGLLLAFACVALMGLLIAALYVLPSLTATTSITVMPVQTPITTTTTLAVVTTGTGSSQHHQVPGRLLSSLTLSGQRTVATTGVGHQDAAFAHGTVTFYNAALYGQTIPAGTLLVGSDGVQIVTDEDAILPATVPPTEGNVAVAAHAVQVGPMGNIRAGDIYGPCCRVDVLAQNTAAFTSGQNARTYPMVTRTDLDGTVTALTATLAQSVQATFAAQVRPDETLLTPVPCVPHVSANHHIGEEATQVTILVQETCTAETYETQAMQTAITQAVTAAAMQHLGAHYTLEGEVQTTVLHLTSNTGLGGSFLLQVKVTGVWAYRFTDSQSHTLAVRIAGKSREQATSLLMDTPGVSQVVMQVSGVTTTLPTDPARIHLLVLYQP
jgi:Baseplate J-like protein